MSMQIESPAFAHDGDMPVRFTCDGQDISPPLAWSGVPGQAKSLVLIVDDPDAPDPKAPKMTWVHWVLYNIPPASSGLPEGVAPDSLPQGTGARAQRLETHRLWGSVSTGGPSSVLPQTLRARYGSARTP
jgi:Raf kinase inhibitor-like YbhB/YbcL family protein